MRSLLTSMVLLSFGGGLAACSQGPQTDFVGTRLPDGCDNTWPVCQTFAGCRLDDTSYVQGNLPGITKFIVNTQGPATITVSVLVITASAEGSDTVVTFFEPGCGVQYRLDADGRSFFAETQSEAGTPFVRSQQVGQGGDHLVTFQSDASASYLLKIDVAEQGQN
jgi:hypothetical protein